MTPTNKPRGFHVPFPRRFNVESTWCVLLLLLLQSKCQTVLTDCTIGSASVNFFSWDKKILYAKILFQDFKIYRIFHFAISRF